MAEYRSKDVTLQGSAERVYLKLTNLEALRDLMTKVQGSALPEDQAKMLDNIKITSDTITIPAGNGPLGEITLRKEGCIEPNMVRLAGVGTPVPMALKMELQPVSETECIGAVVVDLDIPVILKPMISGPINKLTSQIAEFLPRLKFDE
ncbi:MAG: hypothetical protein NC201_08055 [Prevotella sp.]|nr:hypothetical protein [Bacteroides sp.]MCM1367180.1 hypothetical protein [Prevotella sp.]MCM1437081.1 hypothetical protein [Prevotella sp.]